MRGIGRRAERGAEAGGATAHGKTGTGHNAHAVRTAAILNLQPHVMDQATRRFDFSQLFIYYEMKRIITESHPPHSLTHSRHSLTHNAIRAGARSAAKQHTTVANDATVASPNCHVRNAYTYTRRVHTLERSRTDERRVAAAPFAP